MDGEYCYVLYTVCECVRVRACVHTCLHVCVCMLDASMCVHVCARTCLCLSLAVLSCIYVNM